MVTVPAEIDVGSEQSCELGVASVPARSKYIDLELRLDLPWEETGRYEHSMLYWSTLAPFDLTQDAAVCVHIPVTGTTCRLRILLPDAVRSSEHVRFRFDPAPGSAAGKFRMLSLRFLGADVDHEEASRIARLEELKDRVRRSCAAAEANRIVRLEHLPQSLSLELTARCNLRCPHCSSHGTPELDRRYNRMPEMAIPQFTALADEVFPSLTTVGLVGRGEPLLVSGRLWQALCDKLRQYQVRLTFVTNGVLVPKRVTGGILPFLETVHVSVDGGTVHTFAANRKGARLDQALDALRYLDKLRRTASLARRPRIGVSWTLMRNNVSELPGFVERATALGIDQLTVRHLLVFHEKDRDQSVVDRPDLCNEPLRSTYEILERNGVRSDCPPLCSEPDSSLAPSSRSVPVVLRQRQRDGCLFVRRTAVVHADGTVPTCSAPFAARAGSIDEASSFADIWNGSTLCSVRAALDTSQEWDQCRHCWYREGRYDSQRRSFDSRTERYGITDPDELTREAWSFDTYRQD